MNEKEKDCLTRFYSVLHDNLRRDGNLRKNSILISFLSSQSASRYRMLRKSTIFSYLIPRDVLTSLLTMGYIQCIDNIDRYAISSKGVWYIEQDRDLINEESLMSYINEKYFIPKIRSNLNDKEKVILFTMISARAFSEKSSVDLKKNDVVKNKWKEILGKSYQLLHDLDLIKKLKKDKFLSTKGNVHVVSSIFRHNNHMVQQTRGIYSYNRNQEYYLDLYGTAVFSEEKLSYLLWKIFKGDISSELIDKVVEFYNTISSRESIYLFNMEEHLFSMPVYDVKVKDAFMDSIISRNKWAKVL